VVTEELPVEEPLAETEPTRLNKTVPKRTLEELTRRSPRRQPIPTSRQRLKQQLPAKNNQPKRQRKTATLPKHRQRPNQPQQKPRQTSQHLKLQVRQRQFLTMRRQPSSPMM
jgi:hypothetical protein